MENKIKSILRVLSKLNNDELTLLKDALEAFIELRTNTDEGNANSGNHGHEGRPGQKGGSLPSGKALNDKVNQAINDLWEKDDYDGAKKKLYEVFTDMPDGTTMEWLGSKITKTGEDKFEIVNQLGGKGTCGRVELCEEIIDAEDKPDIKINEPKAKKVAEAKIENGKLKPKDTSVKTKKFRKPEGDFKTFNEACRHFAGRPASDVRDEIIAKYYDMDQPSLKEGYSYPFDNEVRSLVNVFNRTVGREWEGSYSAKEIINGSTLSEKELKYKVFIDPEDEFIEGYN